MTTSSLLTEPLIKDHHFGFFAGETHLSSFRSAANTSNYLTSQSNANSSSAPNDFAPPNSTRRVSFNTNGKLHLPPLTMSHGEGRTQSPDGSATSGGANSSGGGHTTKTGRKGDPRMHRSVSARLNDPNMTLFEALKVGGFDYPDDNNPNHLDGEKITLAQRKNQLSRRLRIARRTDVHTKFPVPSPTDNQNKFETLVEKQKQSFQIMQQTMEQQRQNSGQHAATSLKRARSAPHGQAIDTSNPQQQSPDSAARRSLLDDDEDNAPQQKAAPQMMAKFHPNFQPLLVPPAGLHYAQSAPFPNTNQQQNAFNMNQGGGMFFSNPGFQIPNMAPTGAPTADGNKNNAQHLSAGSMQSASGNANISGVAMRSLNNTAQSVGMSLEQLALALSSTRNLAQIVLGNEDEGSASEQKKKKQELALQLYQHEARPVYARCMLLAGFKSEMTSETSKEYLKFSWKAWQKEGRRLRDLLEENDMLVDEAPDFTATDEGSKERPAKKAKTNPPEEEEEVDTNGGHSHTHAHSHEHNDCHTEDGRHIHRIEKCGHKAILHQPKDGEAHIDFVVGDKVECYEGVSTREGNSKWPSQYPCDKCETDAADEMSDPDQPPKENAPKFLDLKAIDLETNEWNVDFVDNTLHGLVRLGEGTSPGNGRSESSQPGNPFSLDGDLGSATV